MLNCEKIKILKENIYCLIKNFNDLDENYIFNFAKQQAKELQIEISKGEIKTIINNIYLSIKNTEKENINTDFDIELDCIYKLEENFNRDFDLF